MNQFLLWITEHNLNKLLYNVLFVAGGVALLLFCIFNAKNYKLPLKKIIPFVLIVYAISLAWMFFLYWAESGFKNFGGNSIVRIFVWVPLFAYPFTKLFGLDFKTICDYLAPVVCVQHGVSHFGCIFQGCCHGYPWAQGIWNPALNYNTFPIQPIEALVAVGIVLFIWLKEKKDGFKVTGKFYPTMLILFGYSRFLLEFARDNEKLFLGVSSLAVHALIMGIVGTEWHIILSHKELRAERRSSHK